MKSLVIGLLLVATSFGAHAQDQAHSQNSVPEQSKVPHAEMQKLAPMVGTWTLAMEYSPDDGATWQKAPSSEVQFSYQMKNLILGEKPLDESSVTFQTASFYSYDQYRKTYRIAVLDDTWGIMDIYEGNIENGILVATNLKAGTTFPMSETVSRAFRLNITIADSTERKMIIEKSDDGGKSWQPNFKLIYTKK